MKFRLKVRKYKCVVCDLIYLVEKIPGLHPDISCCPKCGGSADTRSVEYMGSITIKEDDE